MKPRDHIIIAIDGPAGAGKSTVARRVAMKFRILYIDSGAMYRAVAWKALREKIDISDENSLEKLARSMKIELSSINEVTSVSVNGEDVTSDIRTPEVTDASSRMATMQAIRAILVGQQQAMGRASSVVMEGRDIGTVVFPDTPYKFYLDASVRERACRRKKDLEQAGYKVDLDRLESEVLDRDNRDRTRAIAPLRKAENAIVIDTTAMTIEQVVNTICERIKEMMSNDSIKG